MKGVPGRHTWMPPLPPHSVLSACVMCVDSVLSGCVMLPQYVYSSVLQEVQDNGLGTLNNIVTVTGKDFDAFNEQIDFSSLKFGKVY